VIITVMWLVPVTGCGGFSDRLQARLDLKKGNQRYLAGDYHGAIKHYDDAVSRVPTLAPAFLNRAYSQEALFRASQTLLERQSLADSAAQAYEKYRQLAEAGHAAENVNLERVEEHLLTLYLDSQQPDKAVGVLEERLRTHPRDLASLQMLANLYMGMGDFGAALDLGRKRIQFEPEKAEGYVALAVMAFNFSHKNLVPDEERGALLDEGARAADRALQLRPDYYEALIYGNLVYREKEKYATTDAEKEQYRKLYTDYQERARGVQQQQGKQGSAGDSTGVKHGG
jgi:tetratricopeptide (TPR) repeat protein